MKSPTHKQLIRFFRKIARLTSHHDVVADHACVTADKLGLVLSEIDPNWWKDIGPMTAQERKDKLCIEIET